MTYPTLATLKHRLNNMHELRIAKRTVMHEREPLTENFRDLARQYIASIDTYAGEKPDPNTLAQRLEKGFTMQPTSDIPESAILDHFTKLLLDYEVACDLKAGGALVRQQLLHRDRLAEGQVA